MKAITKGMEIRCMQKKYNDYRDRIPDLNDEKDYDDPRPANNDDFSFSIKEVLIGFLLVILTIFILIIFAGNKGILMY